MIDYHQFAMRLIKDQINDAITPEYYVYKIETRETELLVRIKSQSPGFDWDDKMISKITNILDTYTPFVRDELKSRGSTKHGGTLTFVLCEKSLKFSFPEIQSSEQEE